MTLRCPFGEMSGTVDRPDECVEVLRRRYQEARKAGLSIAEAQLFSESDIDVGQLRRLVRAGCPPAVIAKIIV